MTSLYKDCSSAFRIGIGKGMKTLLVIGRMYMGLCMS